MLRFIAITLTLIAVPLAAQTRARIELPLDLAYSSNEVTRRERPALSPNGQYLAFEVFTPPVKVPDSGGDVEARILPSGMPSDKVGLRLWVSELATGETRPLCEAPVTCWRGEWSPDGGRLAYYSDESGSVGLWIFDTSKGARRLGDFVIKPKLWPGDQPAWSRDGRTIFVPLRPPDAHPATSAATQSITAPEGHREASELKPTVTVYRTKQAAASAGEGDGDPTAHLNAFMMRENNATLAAVDAETGSVRVVVPHDAEMRPSALRLSPDGRWLSYVTVYRIKSATEISAYQDLVVVPASGGPPVAVFRDLKLPEDDYFGLSYRWAPDSKRILFWKDHDLWLSEIPARGEPRRLGASLGTIAEQPFLMTEDGRHVLVGLEPEGEKTYYFVPPRALALIPVDGSTPLVIEVSGTPVRRDESTLLQPSPATFYLIRDVEGEAKREVVRVDIRSGATERVWVGQGRLNVVGRAPRTEHLIVRFEGLSTPADYYLFDQDFRVVRRLSEGEPRLSGVEVGPMEAFDTIIPGHDGHLKRVRTHIFLPPEGRAGGKYPTIVYFYSGLPFHLYAQDFGGGAPNSIPVQIFATRGYAVLFCDVPLGPQGEGGNPMQEMTDAVLAQVYRSAELGFTDIERVGIMGQSYGGYSTAAVLTETKLFRAGAALAGLYDLAGGYARMDQTGGSFNFIWSETGQGRMGTHPWADLKRYIQNSPYYQADKIHTPLLIIHGEKDSTCPVEDAKKMFNAMKRLDREAELAVYAGEGHVPGSWSLVNAIDATERMLSFFERHLRD